MSTSLLRTNEVLRRVGISRQRIYALMRGGRFPAPVKAYDGGRSSFWRDDEIEAWISSRTAARDQVAAELAEKC
jgi:prophage regulatory protein